MAETLAGPMPLGEFEQLLLFALLRLDEHAYGVAIRQEIERRTGRQVSAGAVYTALGRLENRGLVVSRIGDSAPGRAGRRRKYYRLKPMGAQALQRCFEGLQEMARGVTPRLAELAGGTGAREPDQ